MSDLRAIDGGVTAPRGFRAAGVHAGIKRDTPDVALLVSEAPAAAAGTFTTNRVQAASVRLCRQRLRVPAARAVVVNSGNANACTGPRGDRDAERMSALAGELLGLAADDVLVCSTGTIGVPLPMDAVERGIRAAAEALSQTGGADAARAIMTTDTAPKQVAAELRVDGAPVRIGGMAKGAGMIEPNMATMLAFLVTDAAVDPAGLQACLSGAVEQSFNRITIDGDRSTNDTVLFMANGLAGNSTLGGDHPDWPAFCAAVRELARDLAFQIVRDGEGATKFVTVRVEGSRCAADAERVARAIANSLLVKTSWYGCDPNWGRVIDAVGYSGADVDPDSVTIRYDEVCAARNGVACEDASLRDLEAVLARPRFVLCVDLGLGEGRAEVYTCDCSEEYVRINSAYMT